MDELGVNKNLPVLRLNRASTGISQFDIMLDGGYKNPASVALVGPGGMEKPAFAFHFISAGIQAGDRILVVTTDRTPDELEKLAAEMGMSIKSELVKYLDCYSTTISAPAPPTPNITQISGPGALNELSLTINESVEQMKAKRLRVVFYSLSTLSLHSQPDSLFKFLSLVDGRLKNANATTLFLVDEGMHDEKFLTQLKHSVDQEFTIKVAEGARFVSSPEFPMDIPIKLGPLGVEVE